MSQITGYVADLRYSPGHPSGEIQVSLRGEPGTVTVLAGDPESRVKLNGERYLSAGLVKLLYLVQSGDVYFTGEELPCRHRACRVVEFKTVPRE